MEADDLDLYGRRAEIYKEANTYLLSENDRGCVLVAAALIEDMLEKLITAKLLPKAVKAKEEDELIGRSANSPVSSFSAKIHLAYRIGIISKQEWETYHQLRGLRNRCAHSFDERSFANQDFQATVANIINANKDIFMAFKKTIIDPPSQEFFEEHDLESTDAALEFVKKIGWKIMFCQLFSLIYAFRISDMGNVERIKSQRS